MRAATSMATGTANCPEIYAYGFRNPWRWSFDRVSGQLWLNDVGQGALEEVDLVVPRRQLRLALLRRHQHLQCDLRPQSASAIPPVAQYGRTQGFSTTGGFVYRGSAIPALHGRYVFGDFGGGNLWHIARDTTPTLTHAGRGRCLPDCRSPRSARTPTARSTSSISAARCTASCRAPAAGRQIPSQLSQTGCVNSTTPTQPASGLIPYAPNAPFFSDGAVKARWLALPDGQRIVIDANNDFDFPNGSVLVKNFSLGATLVETRLFMRHNDGSLGWLHLRVECGRHRGHARRRRQDRAGCRADLAIPERSAVPAMPFGRGRPHAGLEIGQLNGDFGYPDRAHRQSAHHAQRHRYADARADAAAGATAGDSRSVRQRARSGSRARAYLHTNCANCHRPGGPAQSDIDFRYTTALAATNACDITPTLGNLGITDPRIIAPGSAARSVAVARVNRVGADAMPPLARHIDRYGGRAIADRLGERPATCNEWDIMGQFRRTSRECAIGNVPIFSRRASLRTSGSASRSSR